MNGKYLLEDPFTEYEAARRRKHALKEAAALAAFNKTAEATLGPNFILK